MRPLSKLALVAGALAAAPAASAHFVWATLAGADGRFRLEFAESPGDSVLPNFVGKGGSVRAFSAPGTALPLTADGNFMVAGEPSEVAGANLTYGVMDRSARKRGVFLLRYHAKAAATPAASVRRVGLPVELAVAPNNQGRLVVVVSRNGVPVPGAEVVVHLPGRKKPIETKSDATGSVTLPAFSGGPLAVRAMVPVKVAGSHGGKEYGLVRHYSTLTVRDPNRRP